MVAIAVEMEVARRGAYGQRQGKDRKERESEHSCGQRKCCSRMAEESEGERRADSNRRLHPLRVNVSFSDIKSHPRQGLAQHNREQWPA